MSKHLSKNQSRILKCIHAFIDKHNYPPSVRDIRWACQISSTSVVAYHLDRLTERGYIKRSPGVSRSITLTKKGFPRRRGNIVNVPIAGELVAEKNIYLDPTDPDNDTIGVAAQMIPTGMDPMAITVADDSFDYALLAYGDTLLIDPNEYPQKDALTLFWATPQRRLFISRLSPDQDMVAMREPNDPQVPINRIEVKGQIIGVMRII